MADPTIQTFCCHSNNDSDMSTVVMKQFNTNAYNIVCMVSSIMGILGAIYQVTNIYKYIVCRIKR